ncbi:hypothetical protein PR048_008950 [Dryococelus australis]|uniref:Uncharacterized protein n=1 Tax=Dryococelus australis TaxID=614101 RepID=A0ABQ9HYJ4_9NEOP|nr:hypothetical protein PR048_008950 [Dryococelus australis]
MPFFWKPRENAITKVSPDVKKEALVQVTENGKSVRATAKDYSMTYYNVAADDFMNANAGIPINIYDIPDLVEKYFGRAFTPENIQKGFVCTGIWPMNSRIFSESDFHTANVTDRPGTTLIQEPIQCGSVNSSVATNTVLVAASTSSSNIAVSPEQLRPFPKIGPRKRSEKKENFSQMKLVTNVKRKCFVIYDERPTELDKSFEYLSGYFEIDSDSDKLSDTSEEEPSIKPTSSEVDEYSLVKFSSKKSVFYYAGKITKKHNEREFEVKFLQGCSRKSKCFVFRDKDDIDDVVIYDMLKLPKPTELSGTERRRTCKLAHTLRPSVVSSEVGQLSCEAEHWDVLPSGESIQSYTHCALGSRPAEQRWLFRARLSVACVVLAGL